MATTMRFLVPSLVFICIVSNLSYILNLNLFNRPNTSQSTSQIQSQSTLPLNRHSDVPRHSLRIDWTNLPVISPIAKIIEASQSRECLASTMNRQKFKKHFMAWSGLGSTIHTWSQSLCHAIGNDMIMATRGTWLWMSEEKCGNMAEKSPLQCYFGAHEKGSPSCFLNDEDPDMIEFDTAGDFFGDCIYNVTDFHAASMEWLFQNVKPIVIEEAERQIRDTFPDGLPNPNNMITVNIRWGDKGREMELQPIERYINAVTELLKERPQIDVTDTSIHIYLATEDPDAINAFNAAAPSSWIIHNSGPTNPVGNKDMMSQANGKNGLESFGALLISMESNGYVLTTGSNWSRLINELRKNVINPRCGNCTKMIDLMYGEWP
jgi:hypothetical protein